MGVTGLWRLIEPAGKPVPVESLENKVIAVDISIWLHQMVKGYQDTKGAPIPNAHLIGLFQRLCKLLYFRVKPVFVFDGAFPDLKKETIAKRQFNKSKYNSESERLKRELALLLSKKSAISSLLGKDISPKKATSNEPNNDDIFKLPALPVSKDETESESDDEQNSSGSVVDLHSVDMESDKFKNLPVKDKYDLLIELKETRKQNSWGRLHELPKKSDNFSDFQLQRLLKRRKVQECLEETEKEMGDGGMSIVELESILNEEGIDTKIESIPTRRIASNNTTRFLLINNVKQALAEAKKKKNLENNSGTSKHIETPISETQPVKKDEPEDDLELAIKMSMECADDEDTTETEKQTAKKDELETDLEKAIKLSLGYEDPDTSNYASKTDDSWTSIMTDSDNIEGTDSEEEDGFEQYNLSFAKAYIMQYTDFTHKAIDEIVSSKSNAVKKKPMFDEILDEINNEKSVIVENIDLSSDEDCKTESIDTRDHDTVVENVTDIDATQSSVICVENPVQEIVSLDTSVEENSEDSNLKSNLEREMSCDLTKTEKKLDTSLYRGVNNAKTSQPMIIPNEKFTSVDSDSSQIKIESSSSDDEFEEVHDIESESKKTVVQLILDMNQECNESDDIFADVFMTKEMRNDANESTKNETKISSETTKVSQSLSNKSDILQEINNFSETQKNVSSEQKKESTVKKDNNNDTLLEEINKKLEISLKNQTIVIKDNELNSNVTTTSTKILEDVNNRLDETVLTNSSEVSKVDSSDPNKIEKSTSRDLTQGSISTERLNEMAEKVASKEQELIQEKGRLDRIGRNITEQMTKEAQELLQMFGIPYIVAPMEAEAQCAFLESANLTDGTITDDSDIWLFGGKTVYKNFFNQKKHVLQFLSERIEKSFNLTREQLVLLALLVGSDYTTGVDGVGPVTAMEILASFPYHKKQLVNETSKQGRYQQIITGLEEFKKWVRAGRRTDNTTLKKKLRNVSLTDDFPSIRVIQAYMEPNVENSKEKFTWGEMDITILRDYTKAKFGWSQSKLDEIINPVLKRIQERKSQKTVEDYFKRKVVFQPLDEQMSKRVKAAVQRMGPDNVLIDVDANIESEEPIPTKKRKIYTKSKTGAAKSVVKPTLIAGLSKISNDMNCPNATVVSSIIDSKTSTDIVIPKTERFQEIIPQREKDKQCLLQNKMKAIELFRKTKIDRKKRISKRKAILPKEKAELSESSDSD